MINVLGLSPEKTYVLIHMSYPMRNKAEFLSAARNIEEVLGNVKCGQTFRK